MTGTRMIRLLYIACACLGLWAGAAFAYMAVETR